MRCCALLLLCLLAFAHAGKRRKRVVGGSPAAIPPLDEPTVHVRFAGRSARIRGVRDFPHYVFKGIRFAHSPVKKERFLRPRQFYLSGDIDATAYPPPCLQPVPGQNGIIGDEDCLFLNVFTPNLPLGMEGLPVVVWIHGGNFRYGSASQYGVKQLVGQQLVVVTIQYRLGTLGFLGSGTRELPGNAALWDMVTAVQWVRNYIGFFGGNPYQIVVMGHGSGASSAVLVALNEVAKGYTNGVIALSGTAISNSAIDGDPQTTIKEIADIQGCPTAAVLPMIKCLQSIPAQRIIEGDNELELNRMQSRTFVHNIQGQSGCIPVREYRYDGRSLPPMIEGDPHEKLQEKPPTIPLLTGVTKDETKGAIGGKFEKEILTKLQTVKHYLDDVLIKSLQIFTPLKSNKMFNSSTGLLSMFKKLDPFQFRNYVTVKRNDLREGLSKIAEMTVDALFNLPAFLSATMWSRTGTPTFLYRFEHSPLTSKAHHFLQGLSLVNSKNEQTNNTVSHGDELIYLFEPQTLNGTAIPNADDDFTHEDKIVKNIFTKIIYNFARTGKFNFGHQDYPSFSEKSNKYLKITSEPSYVNDFRFCEMALWAGITERLQSATCKALDVLQSQIKNAESLLFDTVDTVQSVGGKIQEKVSDLGHSIQSGVQETKDVISSFIPKPFAFLGNRNKQNKTRNN
ncbi:hypothetical protein FQR65_LT00383 [Abscondita terminalis]|nr:hypothetical protein FQR65_LT00383 [Abscondita terminalis]